jgi:hypothetical protein
MKDLINFDRIEEANKLETPVKKKVEHQLVGTLVPNRGHTLYKIHTDTLEVSKADEFESTAAINPGTNSIIYERKVLMKSEYVYISALNASSALKRHRSGKGSSGLAKTGFVL